MSTILNNNKLKQKEKSTAMNITFAPKLLMWQDLIGRAVNSHNQLTKQSIM